MTTPHHLLARFLHCVRGRGGRGLCAVGERGPRRHDRSMCDAVSSAATARAFLSCCRCWRAVIAPLPRRSRPTRFTRLRTPRDSHGTARTTLPMLHARPARSSKASSVVFARRDRSRRSVRPDRVVCREVSVRGPSMRVRRGYLASQSVHKYQAPGL